MPTSAIPGIAAAGSGPPHLRLIRLGYWGFDGRPHVGAVVVNFAVVDAVSKVFEQL
ncbi:MAG TPA: hypothetical protein VFM96_06420 [Gaiellaceae bacterium]|nr:hypothetical protein [Gaiellaceae bacterium]